MDLRSLEKHELHELAMHILQRTEGKSHLLETINETTQRYLTIRNQIEEIKNSYKDDVLSPGICAY
jgi:hypothetical protein